MNSGSPTWGGGRGNTSVGRTERIRPFVQRTRVEERTRIPTKKRTVIGSSGTGGRKEPRLWPETQERQHRGEGAYLQVIKRLGLDRAVRLSGGFPWQVAKQDERSETLT